MFFCKRKKKKDKPKKGTVDYNASKMRKKYPLDEWGRFGEKGDNKRVICSNNVDKESKRFYNKVSKGGSQKQLDNGHGTSKEMVDGGIVVYRQKTKTKNSPAVDFNKMQGKVANQKVHFVKKEKKNGK